MKTINLKNLEGLLGKENLDKYYLEDLYTVNEINKLEKPLSIGTCLLLDNVNFIEIFKIKEIKFSEEDEFNLLLANFVGDSIWIGKEFPKLLLTSGEGDIIFGSVDTTDTVVYRYYKDYDLEFDTALFYLSKVINPSKFDEIKQFMEKTIDETIKRLNDSVSVLIDGLK